MVMYERLQSRWKRCKWPKDEIRWPRSVDFTAASNGLPPKPKSCSFVRVVVYMAQRKQPVVPAI